MQPTPVCNTVESFNAGVNISFLFVTFRYLYIDMETLEKDTGHLRPLAHGRHSGFMG